MMVFSINNRHFKIIVASDVQRDGLGWELWEHKDGTDILLSEIFRSDESKTIDYIAYKTSDHIIPLEALEFLIGHFNSTGGRNFLA
jgi:hypothetical protein